MQENLKAKYGITDEELKRAVDQIPFGKIACDGCTLVALVDLVSNGDIEGSAKKTNVIFAGSAHREFVEKNIAKCKQKDCWHRALIYTLGLTEDIRNHITEVYDFEKDRIISDSLHKGWVTGTDGRVMRLAFNLFTDDIPEDGNEKRYAVSEIFGYIATRYLCQAIMLRFEC